MCDQEFEKYITIELQAKATHLETALAADPVGAEVLALVQAPAKADAKLMLKMAFFLFQEAVSIEKFLGKILEGERPARGRKIATVIGGLFDGREVVDPGLANYFFKNPAELTLALQLGWNGISKHWPTLLASEKGHFVETVLRSSKGYTKTFRDIDSFTPPSKSLTGALLRKWLDSFNNTSVFTGLARGGGTKTNRQQVEEDWGKHKRGSAERRQVLFTVITKIIEGKSLGWADKGKVQLTVKTDLAEIKAVFDGLISAQELEQELGENFDEIWESFLG